VTWVSRFVRNLVRGRGTAVTWPKDSRGRWVRVAGPDLGLICERCNYPKGGAICLKLHSTEVRP
jgi:hypothetical protein